MCVPLGGRRCPRWHEPRKEKEYPKDWMNEKRVVKDDGIYSADGKTLVKVNPDVTGTYVIAEGVEKVLVDAFRKCNCKEIVFHPGVVTIVRESMFKGCDYLTITLQTGKTAVYNGFWKELFFK